VAALRAAGLADRYAHRANPSISKASAAQRAVRLSQAAARRGRFGGGRGRTSAQMAAAFPKFRAVVAAGRRATVIATRNPGASSRAARLLEAADRRARAGYPARRGARHEKHRAVLRAAARARKVAARRRLAITTTTTRQVVRRSNPKGGKYMARRRRRSVAQRRAFKRMLAGLKKFKARFSRKKKRRARPRRKRPAAVVVVKRNGGKHMARRHKRKGRRRTTVVMVNPRRHRRRKARRHHGRRRNPGGFVGALISQTVRVGIPALVAGAGLGVVDAKLLPKLNPLARTGIKVGIAAVGGAVLRKKPEIAKPLIAAVLGTIGYEQGVRFAGGVIAPTAAEGAKQLSALVREDPLAMGYLVQSMRGMGLQIDTSASLSGMGQGDLAFQTPSSLG
jgi:hypothetical protein